MSILLDALRKSEQRERLGSVPDIHEDTEQPAVRRHPGWRLPLAALTVLLVLILAAWLGWRAWTGTPVPVAPPELPPEPASAAPAPAPAREAERAGDSAGDTDGDQVGQQAAGPSGDRSVASAAAPRPDRQPRSPVEVLSGDRPHRQAGAGTVSSEASAADGDESSTRGAPAADERSATARTGADATGGEEGARGAEPRDLLDMLTRAVEEAGVDAPDEAPADEPPGAGRPDPRPASRPRDEPGLISYWQLPENVRSGLPEPRITVLAWDANPEARFAILGGKRFGEGARVASNLTLEEIRRDRVLFRHGAYLFYVKQ